MTNADVLESTTGTSPTESLTRTSVADADGINSSSASVDPPYVMHIDLRVLEHLGIRLYSNAAAVLSEVVANSWDAEASEVKIDLADDQVTIEDDGVGMDRESINGRFLTVGYDKRTKEGAVSSNKNRPFMGRKGIGKLSLFSIAETIEIHTIKNGEKNAFLMKVPAIQAAIKARKPYHPESIEFAGNLSGTKIVLTDLKKQRTAATRIPLTKRIARRFSVLGMSAPPKGPFSVKINEHPVTSEDRDDLQRIEFLWEFGVSDISVTSAAKKIKWNGTLDSVVNHDEKWLVKGWLGTVPKPNDLRTDDSGSMNGIVVMARGRLIQENILDKLGFNKILGNYLVGQVEADFLDLEDQDDIATSDRQRLIEDDPRYVQLCSFLKRALESIASDWTSMRNAERAKDAEASTPVLADWVGTLDQGQKKHAQSMLGLIQGLELETEEQRLELYKSGILAFERMRMRSTGDAIAALSDFSAVNLLPLLSDLASLEGTMYRDIVKQRLEVIDKFKLLVDIDEKEKILQQCLFDNMWLLDPGWERATGSAVIEQTLKKEYGEFAENLNDEESKGRLDIRYKTNAGQHIIVELKRARRKLKATELAEQGRKYNNALKKCLRKMNGPDYNPNVAVVFVVGSDLDEIDDLEYIERQMSSVNGRVVYYQQLIESARNSYGDYMRSSEKLDKITGILNKL